MDDQIKQNLTATETWIRLVFMLLFGVISSIALWLVWVIAGFQFVVALITRHTNDNLTEFSDTLIVYLDRVFAFLLYRSEEKPFPFASWPSGSSRAATKKPAAKTKRALRSSNKKEEESAK